MQPLLIGSNNSHKIEEMSEILRSGALDFELRDPETVANFPTYIPETGLTLEENAYLKAAAIFAATGIACVSDDTGLEVDSLDGAPGVRSARYAGETASYADNRAKLLSELCATPDEQRTARFRTIICYHDSIRVFFAEGICEGHIIRTERGESGFGYDSIFVPQTDSRTFAELATEEKNLLSHRALALRRLVEILRSI